MRTTCTIILLMLSILKLKTCDNKPELYTLFPATYPKVETKITDDGYTSFEKFDLKIKRNDEILYNNELLYKCQFPEYYEYLIEVFSDSTNFIIVSPLPKIKTSTSATPYNVDRSIVFVFDLKNQKKYYVNFDVVKQIHHPEVFEMKKDLPIYMIKNINDSRDKMILLKGGDKLTEIELEMFEW